MEALTFSAFQRELEDIELDNPELKFNNRSVKIITSPFLADILGQLLLWIIIICLNHNTATFFGAILFLGFSLYLFYFSFIGLGICQIDCISKKITYKNRIIIFNVLRKIFGFKSLIDFSEIKEISYKEGLLLDRFSSSYNTRYQLLIETHSRPGVIITQFKTEESAKKMVQVLEKYILNNEKIIA